MPTSRRGRNNRPSGFTLIELSIALTIIAILLLTVLPKIPSVLGNDSKTLLRSLAERVEREMENALLSGAGGKLKLNFEANTVSFYPSGKKEKKWELNCNGILSLLEVTTNFGARYTSGEVTIPLSSIGMIPETRIRFLEKKTGKELSVEINPFNGKVTVKG